MRLAERSIQGVKPNGTLSKLPESPTSKNTGDIVFQIDYIDTLFINMLQNDLTNMIFGSVDHPPRWIFVARPESGF